MQNSLTTGGEFGKPLYEIAFENGSKFAVKAQATSFQEI